MSITMDDDMIIMEEVELLERAWQRLTFVKDEQAREKMAIYLLIRLRERRAEVRLAAAAKAAAPKVPDADRIVMPCMQCGKESVEGPVPLCAEHIQKNYCRSCYQPAYGTWQHCDTCHKAINQIKATAHVEYPQALEMLKAELLDKKFNIARKQ